MEKKFKTKTTICEFCFEKIEWPDNLVAAVEVCPYCKKENVCVDLNLARLTDKNAHPCS